MKMQRLKFSRTGESKLIDFLHENCGPGVSMVFVEINFDETLTKKKMRIAVRAESGGYMKIKNVRYDLTRLAIVYSHLWPLQWTNVETRPAMKVKRKLFILSYNIDWLR